MTDSYGRKIDYLRISVTDRCNLRCRYCMPADGIERTSHEALLTFAEIERVCRIAASLGFRKIKLTGGEPLVRRNLPELAAKLRAVEGIDNITLTTNGVALAENAAALKEAGIDAINVSLDTLDAKTFEMITRRDSLADVLGGIDAALACGGMAVKINCVPLGIPGQRLEDVAELARDRELHVRFIEMMPIGYGKDFHYQSEDEVLSLLEMRFGKFVPYAGEVGNGPCRYFRNDAFKGKIGFISAMSHKFCGSCNRVRLTSQGYLRTCLQFETGADLRAMLRGGGTDAEIRAVMEAAIAAKPAGHSFSEGNIENGNTHIMSEIGG